ncbi:MAG: hypothetical protein CMJ27_08455 [Phycisphaerae bacterium]|nr:hypothetical protein [Phycisphaerae bacterium]OUX01236.1 MAG: hypothetical protein CBD91_04860 [Phycisphaeraceae bacterium TMED231]
MGVGSFAAALAIPVRIRPRIRVMVQKCQRKVVVAMSIAMTAMDSTIGRSRYTRSCPSQMRITVVMRPRLAL